MNSLLKKFIQPTNTYFFLGGSCPSARNTLGGERVLIEFPVVGVELEVGREAGNKQLNSELLNWNFGKCMEQNREA